VDDLRKRAPGLLKPSDLAPGLVLGDGVEIGPGVEIGANVVIHARTTIAAGVVIQDCAIVGKPPRLGPRSSAPRDPVTGTILGEESAVLAGAIIFGGAKLGHGAIAADQCQIRERAVIGAETVIGRGSAIDNDVRIGAGVRVQTNCYLTAYTMIEDDVFLGPGVMTTNDHTMGRHEPGIPLEGARLRRACRIGGGAVLCPGVEIGQEAFVAAGAVVTADVASRAVVMGVPAMQVREVPDRDLLERWRSS
jgi:UDP-2-acetamido-3-amino-2,3-dideoxy-glucuronate N-acetyltransferase